MSPGDTVTWLYTPRGGYGYRIPVDVVVIKVGAHRVQVEAPLASGGTRRIWVTPEKLVRAALAPAVSIEGVCAHRFDRTVCVAPAGHSGPHTTSNNQFPHGLAIVGAALAPQETP